MMNRRVLGLALVLICVAGFAESAVAQAQKAQKRTQEKPSPARVSDYFRLPAHPTALDRMRQTIFDKKANSEGAFRQWLGSRAPGISLMTATLAQKTNYYSWLAARILGLKLASVKFPGSYDFGGQNGNTLSFSPGISFEMLKIFKYVAFSLDINSGLKRDNKIMSGKLTAGGKFEAPEVKDFLTIYAKAGAGAMFPGGGDPTSMIIYCGPGIGLRPEKSEKIKLEIDLLYYWASNAIFNDDGLKKKYDFILSFSTTFSFPTKRVVISQ